MSSSLGLRTRLARSAVPTAAMSAAAVTIPHALGLGLLAFAPVAGDLPVATLALWSAALPGAIASLVAGRPGVVYAPTTVVALLYAAVVASLAGAATSLGMTAPQVLAACSATAALACGFQWLFGAMRLASLARFLPISVTHGFAAGVGLAMVVGQLRSGFGAGTWSLSAHVAVHAAAALGVVGVAVLAQRRWPRMPGLLTGVVAVAVLVGLGGWGSALAPAAVKSGFALPPWPDHAGVPWRALLEAQGLHLVSLALLMAVVNSLEVLVFNQELELDHGLRGDPNRALRRESAIGALCALCGLIPASTSASRSRIVLARAGASSSAGMVHALLLLLVAATGHWWLDKVPMACLSGALILAGLTQVPAVMWSRGYAQAAPAAWSQGWLVALVFCVAGGAGALVAGLVVATFVLLRASASSAIRRGHLDGEVRSRRLRRAVSESWLAPRMNRLAVIELQGMMSFGVAAYMAEQVRALLRREHEWVILDVTRVPAWDATALVQVRALGRDLAQQRRQLAVAGADPALAAQLGVHVEQFADLDRALEWAEDAILVEQPALASTLIGPHADLLGELGEGVSDEARYALEAVFTHADYRRGECIFRDGDSGRELCIVRSGHVTMATQWPPGSSLRLATIGHGMAFGEMAFLNGQPRTACAGAEGRAVHLLKLDRPAFEAWAADHPRDALVFLNNLALMGTRRLAATTRQLRAVLENGPASPAVPG
ncbi:SulP family inorganic anion transporter [Ramlibacter sp. MMS24-I3-19]|uniref:SulP family inorganic anion transporter n=1 Tax=Ramlibacter sp. MMS24-I3-19 TaxID=3416606 RepID=UPI003CFC0376